MKGRIHTCLWCGREIRVPYGGDMQGWTSIMSWGEADDGSRYEVPRFLCPSCSEIRKPSGLLRAEDV